MQNTTKSRQINFNILIHVVGINMNYEIGTFVHFFVRFYVYIIINSFIMFLMNLLKQFSSLIVITALLNTNTIIY